MEHVLAEASASDTTWEEHWDATYERGERRFNIPHMHHLFRKGPIPTYHRYHSCHDYHCWYCIFHPNLPITPPPPPIPP